MGSFLLLRHAQSTWNASGRWQGHADPPLSSLGRDQTEMAAASLGSARFDMVVTSDLTRARQTAALLTTHLELVVSHFVEPLLREFDVGEWSGHTREEIDRLWPDQLALFDQGRLECPPGGESRTDFNSRVLSASAAVARLAEHHDAHSVLVVSHGGVIRSLARTTGVGDERVSHLAGYQGRRHEGRLSPETYVDLLQDRS